MVASAGLYAGISLGALRDNSQDANTSWPIGAVDDRGRVVNLSSDQEVLWRHGFVVLNVTIVTTWGLMTAMAVSATLVTRNLKTEGTITRWQSALEMIVTSIQEQIKEVGLSRAREYLPFLGTLFLFVAVSSLCTVIPGFSPPTGSLSTTAGLALCVFLAVPLFGIKDQGLSGYLISELSRTLALAVRLFGNMMSGTMIIAILLTITPLLFPIVMTALGLLTGMVQAYIFSILAAVYIAAAVTARSKESPHG
jgi:F-type H+-transporting ATPase subunit a